ncbi:MAG TPA: hypothetical protein VHU23_13305 [Rhizomicrobium sp.]|nr:hypothetical protein [Rhizomicrobium sp.]
MPWGPETPYVAKMFARDNDEPEMNFFETTDQLEREIEKHKRSGLCARIWTGHGKSPDQNEWEEIGNWEQGG